MTSVTIGSADAGLDAATSRIGRTTGFRRRTLKQTIVDRSPRSEFGRVLAWAALVSVPGSWAMKVSGAVLIQSSGTVVLFLLAPGYAVLERAGRQPSPPWTALAVYYLLQFAYYVALTAVLRWWLRTQDD